MSFTQSHCLAHGGPTWTVDFHNQIRGGYHASILAVIVRAVSSLAGTDACGDHDMVLWCASAEIPAVMKSQPRIPFSFRLCFGLIWIPDIPFLIFTVVHCGPLGHHFCGGDYNAS